MTENIPHLLNEITADAVFGIEFGRWLTPVVSLMVLGVGLGVARRHPAWGVWVGLTLAMMIFVLPVDRYLLPVLPMIIYGWWTTIVWLNRHLRKPWGDLAFAILLLLGTGANVTKVCAIVVDQHRPDFMKVYKEGRYGPLAEVAQQIHHYAGPRTVILAPAKTARVLSFWSDRKVIELYDYTPPDPTKQKIWVVMDPAEREKTLEPWMSSLNLTPGPVVASIDRPGGPPLTLHRTMYRPTTQPTP